MVAEQHTSNLDLIVSTNSVFCFCFFLLAERDVTQFLADYRELCPTSSIFPKLHSLEDHVVSFVRKWKVGPGMMGEHGAESIHHLFNKLGERYCGMMRSAATRLSHTLKQHLLEANPDMPSPPEPARKKRKD